MYQAVTARRAGVRFYMPIHLLTVLANCFEGKFVTGGKFSHGQIVLGVYYIRGQFVLGGYCPRWIFDWGSYCPVVFVWGIFDGSF